MEVEYEDGEIIATPLGPDPLWTKPAMWFIMFGFLIFIIFMILFVLKIGIQYSMWLMIFGIIILVIGLIWYLFSEE